MALSSFPSENAEASPGPLAEKLSPSLGSKARGWGCDLDASLPRIWPRGATLGGEARPAREAPPGPPAPRASTTGEWTPGEGLAVLPPGARREEEEDFVDVFDDGTPTAGHPARRPFSSVLWTCTSHSPSATVTRGTNVSEARNSPSSTSMSADMASENAERAVIMGEPTLPSPVR